MIEFIGWCVVVSFCFGTGLFGLLISFIIGFFYPLMWIVTAIQTIKVLLIVATINHKPEEGWREDIRKQSRKYR